MRFCIDKQIELNYKNGHLQPRIEKIYDNPNSLKFFCTLKLAIKYNQLKMHFDDWSKPEFNTFLIYNNTSCRAN